MKRILLIIGIFAVAAGIVGLGIFLKGGAPAKTGQEGGEGQGTLPLPSSNGVGAAGGTGGGSVPGATPEGTSGGATASGGITAASQIAILDYAVNASGTLYMVDTAGGLVDASGSQGVVNQGGFNGVNGAWFSPDGKWLLVSSGSSDALRWSLLDVTKRTWKDLPVNTSEMAWSPTGNLLAYFARRSDGAVLTIFDPQKNSSRPVLSLAAPDLVLRWQNLSRLFVMDRPSARVAGNVWSVDAVKGSVTVFASNVRGTDVRWGGSREQGLYFAGGASGGALSLVDSGGTASARLSFLTLASKCVFGDVATATTTGVIADYLFCAIPQDANALRNHQLPDDYLQKKFGTSDVWYAVSTLTGAFQAVVPASQSFTFDAANPKIYGEDLYFTNRNDQKLYRVGLAAVSIR